MLAALLIVLGALFFLDPFFPFLLCFDRNLKNVEVLTDMARKRKDVELALPPAISSKRNKLLALFFSMLFLASAFFLMGAGCSEKADVQELRSFISEYVANNRYRSISDSEIELLAENVYEASKRYGIDPKLIISLIVVESSFNRNAVSHKGARGLMQLLPTTASFVAEELGIEYNCYSELSDIGKNVALGTHYLHMLAQKYGGDKNKFLTAYNYGPGNVDRMIRQRGNIPLGYASRIMRIYNDISI